MQRTDKAEQAQSGRRRIQSSTTLNRRYVKRPGRNLEVVKPVSEQEDQMPGTEMTITRSPKIHRFNDSTMQWAAPAQTAEPIPQAEIHPVQEAVNTRMQNRRLAAAKIEPPKSSAKELKDRAIKQALETAAASESITTTAKASTQKKSKNKTMKVHFGFGRVLLALSCAAVAVFAIVYFVNLSMPDVSLKVAAMQTGINAAYPNYVPRDYSISSITSENKKIVLEFKNASADSIFTLTEETSSWDSNALLSNYVKDTYGDNYTVVKEQGLTIFISGSDAAWVNGGVVYKLDTKSGSLTNKQIRSIATSL